MKTVLVTGFYEVQHEPRMKELNRALRKNLEHPLIQKVVLVQEDDPVFRDADHALHMINTKAKVHKLKRRGTFADFFAIAAEQSDPGDRIIVCNADVWFDDTLALLTHDLFVAPPDRASKNARPRIMAISRHWPQPDGTLKLEPTAPISQDAWVWIAPGPSGAEYAFHAGALGCDNVLVRLFREQGFDVRNPSYSVHVIHEHESKFVKYLPTVPGPHPTIVPCRVEDIPKCQQSA